MTEALRRAFAEAAAGGRVGALKEVMTAQYTRLAQLTEDLIARLVQDTEVRTGLVCQYRSCAAKGQRPPPYQHAVEQRLSACAAANVLRIPSQLRKLRTLAELV